MSNFYIIISLFCILCIGLSNQTESGVVLMIFCCIGMSTQTPSGVVLIPKSVYAMRVVKLYVCMYKGCSRSWFREFLSFLNKSQV